MLTNYLKIAWRNLWRNRLYSLLNVGGLALGLACCLLIALYVADELSYDRFHTHYDHIYRVVEKQQQPEGIFDVAVTPAPLADALTRGFPDVQQTVRVGRWYGLLTHGRQAVEAEQMRIVDPSFFSLFSFPLVVGNAHILFHSADEIVLSEALAERLFGPDWRQKNVLGQAVRFNKDQTLTLVGVARNPPLRSHIQFDALLPYKWAVKYDVLNQNWNSTSFQTYVQLRTKPSGATADATSFAQKIRFLPKTFANRKDVQLHLQPLSAIHLHSNFAFDTDWTKQSDILYIRIFGAVGLIVLLIAVINFINLATARSSQRAKEVGVRKTVGAQRFSLVGQFLGESLLTTAFALALSLLLAEGLLPLFNDLSGKILQIPYETAVFWLILTWLMIVVSLLTGLYPAFVLSSFRPVRVLKGDVGLGVRSDRTLRQSLVVGQFALSIALGIGTLLIQQQLTYVQQHKLGFDQSQLLYVRLKGDLRFKAPQLRDEVRQLPGVERASLATGNLVDVINSGDIAWEGQRTADQFQITNLNVDAAFVQTAGLSLVTGRNFSAQVPSDTSRVLGAFLINETAAKRMGWTPQTALGKRVTFWNVPGRVIGVVKDFHFRPLRATIEPFILRYQPTNPYFTLLVKTTPRGIQRTLTDLALLYKRADSDNPLTYGFVDQDLDAQYRTEQRTGRIILYFSILTLLVSCLGLFGLAAFTAEQRTKEMGIRKILGASVTSIVTLLSKDFLKLVLIAILIASPLAYYAMNRWLADFAYRINISWWVFALAGLLAVSIALLTVSFQSIRAALMNPVKSLRSE